MENCIFCKIVKGELPAYKIYENNDIFAFLDINPVNPGHTLVIPKKHFENIYEVPEEIAGEMMKTTKKISMAVKKGGADGVNITVCNDKAAGQVVYHSHIHVIPRKTGDGLAPWPQKKATAQELEKTSKKIISML